MLKFFSQFRVDLLLGKETRTKKRLTQYLYKGSTSTWRFRSQGLNTSVISKVMLWNSGFGTTSCRRIGPLRYLCCYNILNTQIIFFVQWSVVKRKIYIISYTLASLNIVYTILLSYLMYILIFKNIEILPLVKNIWKSTD